MDSVAALALAALARQQREPHLPDLPSTDRHLPLHMARSRETSNSWHLDPVSPPQACIDPRSDPRPPRVDSGLVENS